MIDAEQVLQAVAKTRPQWETLLREDECRDLDYWLTEATSGDPKIARKAANMILDLLERYPQAWSRIVAALGAKEGLHLELTRSYDPLPGEGDAIPVSTVMVCPVDPTHYRKHLRQKGQRLFCPEHGVELVPEDKFLTQARK